MTDRHPRVSETAGAGNIIGDVLHSLFFAGIALVSSLLILCMCQEPC